VTAIHMKSIKRHREKLIHVRRGRQVYGHCTRRKVATFLERLGHRIEMKVDLPIISLLFKV